MKGRRAARRLAVDALYEAEIRDRLPTETFEIQQAAGKVVAGEDEGAAPQEDPGTHDDAVGYGRSLVEGVQEHHAAIDEMLARYADRWAIDRMPVIDRTLLRIALFELLWGQDIPVPVAINEAVELAKELSTEDSGRFINGLLGRIAEKERV
jgi:N utilization substance protein B